MAHPWRVLIPVGAAARPRARRSCTSAWAPATPPRCRPTRSRGAATSCCASISRARDANQILVVLHDPERRAAHRERVARRSTTSAAGSPRAPASAGWRASWISIPSIDPRAVPADSPPRPRRAAARLPRRCSRPPASRLALLVASTRAAPPSCDEARALVRDHPARPSAVRRRGARHRPDRLRPRLHRRGHRATPPSPSASSWSPPTSCSSCCWARVLLPLKAVVMNLLSISASYGALVWIFQDGHLARLARLHAGPDRDRHAASSCSASCSGSRWTTRCCC